MPSGTVKWFNNAKGYGFIVPEGGGEDLFAHFSAVNMEGYKTLSAGDQVQFDVTVGDKGPQATNIVSSAAATHAESCRRNQEYSRNIDGRRTCSARQRHVLACRGGKT